MNCGKTRQSEWKNVNRIEETGYIESLQAEDMVEAETRIENIDELLSKVAAYEEDCEDRNEPASLSGFQIGRAHV